MAVSDMRADDGRPHIRRKLEESDPTAAQAIRDLTPIKKVMIDCDQSIDYPEQWLIVMDKTWSWAKAQNDCRYEVARRRYAKEDYRQTCRELYISDRQRRRLLDLVRIYAALHAVQLGLIKV